MLVALTRGQSLRIPKARSFVAGELCRRLTSPSCSYRVRHCFGPSMHRSAVIGWCSPVNRPELLRRPVPTAQAGLRRGVASAGGVTSRHSWQDHRCHCLNPAPDCVLVQHEHDTTNETPSPTKQHSRLLPSTSIRIRKKRITEFIMLSNTMLSALFLQLWMAFVAVAAPVAEQAVTGPHHGNAWQYGTGGGIIGLIVLVLDIIVFSTSPSSSTNRTCANCCSSRGLQVEPPPVLQDPVVSPGLPLPHPRYHHLLALLEPCPAQQRRRLRASGLSDRRIPGASPALPMRNPNANHGFDNTIRRAEGFGGEACIHDDSPTAGLYGLRGVLY